MPAEVAVSVVPEMEHPVAVLPLPNAKVMAPVPVDPDEVNVTV
jgi:hypothetical protein